MVLSLRVLSHRGHLDSRSFTHIYGGVTSPRLRLGRDLEMGGFFFPHCGCLSPAAAQLRVIH